MKYYSYHPAIFPNMVGAVSSDAGPGDLVHVYDKEGQLFGAGYLNPKARVPLRVLDHHHEEFDEAALDAREAHVVAMVLGYLRP